MLPQARNGARRPLSPATMMTTTTIATVQRRDGSSLGTCGFVLHILCIPITVLYLSWALMDEEALIACGITYYPPKSWALLLPPCLVLAFFAAPLLYAACNILATPKVNSIHTIWDDHSREPCTPLESNSNNGSIVPAICDLDIASINAMVDLNEGTSRWTEGRS